MFFGRGLVGEMEDTADGNGKSFSINKEEIDKQSTKMGKDISGEGV